MQHLPMGRTLRSATFEAAAVPANLIRMWWKRLALPCGRRGVLGREEARAGRAPGRRARHSWHLGTQRSTPEANPSQWKQSSDIAPTQGAARERGLAARGRRPQRSARLQPRARGGWRDEQREPFADRRPAQSPEVLLCAATVPLPAEWRRRENAMGKAVVQQARSEW